MIITVLFHCYFSLGGKLFSLRLRYLIVVYLESLLSFFFFAFSLRETLERWARGANRDNLEEW